MSDDFDFDSFFNDVKGDFDSDSSSSSSYSIPGDSSRSPKAYDKRTTTSGYSVPEENKKSNSATILTLAGAIIFIIGLVRIWNNFGTGLLFMAAGVFLTVFFSKRIKKATQEENPNEYPFYDSSEENLDVKEDIEIPKRKTQSLIEFEYPSQEQTKNNKGYTLKSLFSLKDFKEFENSVYVVLDVETTGLSPYTDAIIELAMLKVYPDKKYETYHSMFYPGRPIPPRITKITGINDDMVKDAPFISDHAKEILDFIGTSYVVAHNAKYDCSFISQMFKRCGLDSHMTAIDTVQLSQRAFPDFENHKLETLIQHLNLNQEKQTHRAKDDALCTQRLLVICIDTLKAQKEKELEDRRERKKQEQESRALKYSISPLYNVSFVFTGNFSLPRETMVNLALSVGGLVREKVTSKTDYLVVGDVSTYPDWALERKCGAADKLIESGGKIRKIMEKEFISMIYDAKDYL